MANNFYKLIIVDGTRLKDGCFPFHLMTRRGKLKTYYIVRIWIVFGLSPIYPFTHYRRCYCKRFNTWENILKLRFRFAYDFKRSHKIL